jgi:hypothetical protein
MMLLRPSITERFTTMSPLLKNLRHLAVAHPVQVYVPKMQSEGHVFDYAADCG